LRNSPPTFFSDLAEGLGPRTWLHWGSTRPTTFQKSSPATKELIGRNVVGDSKRPSYRSVVESPNEEC